MHIVATAHDLRAADPQGKQYTDLGLKLSLFILLQIQQFPWK